MLRACVRVSGCVRACVRMVVVEILPPFLQASRDCGVCCLARLPHSPHLDCTHWDHHPPRTVWEPQALANVSPA